MTPKEDQQPMTTREELVADEFCTICGALLNFEHDHRPDNSGLDDGPEIRPARKRPVAKDRDEVGAIRARAWATRRLKYGEHGHR